MTNVMFWVEFGQNQKKQRPIILTQIKVCERPTHFDYSKFDDCIRISNCIHLVSKQGSI
jgi:hypothetical protein